MNALFPLFFAAALAVLVPTLPPCHGLHPKRPGTGLDAVSSAVLPDGRILAIEKYGKVTLIRTERRWHAVPGLTSKTNSRFEKGMMAILADPNFATNNYIYVWYTNQRRQRQDQLSVHGDRRRGGRQLREAHDQHGRLGPPIPSPRHGHRRGRQLYVPRAAAAPSMTALPGLPYGRQDRIEGKILRSTSPKGYPSDNPFYTPTRDGARVYFYGLRQLLTMSTTPRPGLLVQRSARQLRR